VFIGAVCCCAFSAAIGDGTPTHDYPTHARVEYVQECIATHGGNLSTLYQCSCVIDRIADKLAYDDFVEAATYAKYASLPGEGGALFRDSDQARQMAKLYRETEAEAARSCGLTR
jgi:hypothetical protein